jgi:hypothetical protein
MSSAFLAWMDGRKLLHESCTIDGEVKWKMERVPNINEKIMSVPEFNKRAV